MPLSDRPGLVQKLLLTNKYNKAGIYKVRFCKDGRWEVITISDTLPMNRNGVIRNAQPVKDEDDGKLLLWAPILEKGWAKLFGSYLEIEAGLISETLTDLTGAPTETFDCYDPNYNKDLMFHKFLSFTRLGYLMGAGSGGTEDDLNDFKRAGLVEVCIILGKKFNVKFLFRISYLFALWKSIIMIVRCEII